VSRRTWVAAASFVAVCVVAVGVAIAAGHGHRASAIEARSGGDIELTAAESSGRDMFVQFCAHCHRLAAVEAVGDVGPDLDFVRPTAAVVRRFIREGSVGRASTMPPGIVTERDAPEVAAFVAKVAGRAR
jgi:mono/diheme cytochrome c family protein